MVYKHTGWFLTGGLILLGFAIVLGPRLFGKNGRLDGGEIHYSPSAPVPESHSESLPQARETFARSSIIDGTDRPSEEISTVGQSSSLSTDAGVAPQHAAAPQDENAPQDGEGEVATAGTDGLYHQSSVIGRPFPVSTSIDAACIRLAQKREDGCPEVHRALSEFSQQPRDLAWAPRMEEKLKNLVMAEPNKYTVRNIECRTSLCIAEVASIYGMFHFISAIGTDEFLDKSLNTDVGEFGYETDSSRTRVTVTLMTFTRR